MYKLLLSILFISTVSAADTTHAPAVIIEQQNEYEYTVEARRRGGKGNKGRRRGGNGLR